MTADRIFLDVSRLVWRAWAGIVPTGIDRTCLAYARHYGDRAHAVVQRGGFTRLLPRDLSRALFDLLVDEVPPSRDALRRLLLRSIFSRSATSTRGGLYLNIGHTGLNQPGHGRWVKESEVRAIYFIHDLIPCMFPEFCRDGEAEKHHRRMTAALGNGVGLIANSQATIDDLSAFAGALRLPPTLAAPLGVDLPMPQARPIGGRDGAPPLFVTVGTIEGRKNHLLLLTIWAELARRLGPGCPRLLVIGRRGWECEQALDFLDRNDAIRGHVIEISQCPDAELRRHMLEARALLFPSFAEGYGLPLAEALGLGTPVIASDLPVFLELAGHVPDYLNPLDGLGWMAAIEDYARPDSERRRAQISRMKAWRPPTWQAHFDLVDPWLDALS